MTRVLLVVYTSLTPGRFLDDIGEPMRGESSTSFAGRILEKLAALSLSLKLLLSVARFLSLYVMS